MTLRTDPLEIRPAWDDTEQAFKPFVINVITTGLAGGAAGSRAFEIQLDGTAKFSIDKDGNIVLGGTANAPVNVTASTVTLSAAAHGGRTTTLNRAAGIAVTLPAATGSGVKFELIVGTTITSNTTTIKVANASDTMAGNAIQSQDGGATLQMWEAAAADDTVTMDGSTRGGLKGDIVRLTDIATNLWLVEVIQAATGTEATPFSATV